MTEVLSNRQNVQINLIVFLFDSVVILSRNMFLELLTSKTYIPYKRRKWERDSNIVCQICTSLFRPWRPIYPEPQFTRQVMDANDNVIPVDRVVRNAPTHGGMARLSCPGWLVTYRDGLPVRIIIKQFAEPQFTRQVMDASWHKCDSCIDLTRRPRARWMRVAWPFSWATAECRRRNQSFHDGRNGDSAHCWESACKTY